MVDTKALFKTFGQGVNAAQQIATDKAVNARRRRPASVDKDLIVEKFTSLLSEPAIVEVSFEDALISRVPVGNARYAAIVSSSFSSFVQYNFQWSIENGELIVEINANNTGTMIFLVI